MLLETISLPHLCEVLKETWIEAETSDLFHFMPRQSNDIVKDKGFHATTYIDMTIHGVLWYAVQEY